MKATEARLLDVLKRSPQFVIPIYQRTYSWTEKECRQLWDDIIRTGSNDAVSAHFIGSVVYIEKGLYQVTSQSPLLIIDGQQRLTTVTLLLAALAAALDDQPDQNKEPVDGFSPRKLRNYYLLNPEEEGERNYKLLLSQTDKASLIAIINAKEDQLESPSIRVTENFKSFKAWIAARNGDFAAICRGLSKLIVVDVALNRDQDNPQLIFESMNSTGRELSQADLIRNFILMGFEPKLQTRLYEEYWRPMEVEFGQEAYGTHFDAFMRHYLTLKTGEIPRIGEVYEAFKNHVREPAFASNGMETLVRDLRNYAKYFCAMALGNEPDKLLDEAFQDLRELKVDVAYPFLLRLYSDYKNGLLSRADFVEAVRLAEAYVFRRAVCNIPANSMNKIFSNLPKSIKVEAYLESIAAYFILLPSYRRFPNDEEFRRDLVVRDLYNFRIRSYWLRRIENFDRKERVNVQEFTVEHILPQNENLLDAWKEDLGTEWKRIQQTWLHTLGNLTLTAYNSEYSDRSFAQKNNMDHGFKESPLNLNKGLGQLSVWNEDAIKQRAVKLAELALKVWSAPALSVDSLSLYQKKTSDELVSYSIEDHPKLQIPHVRELFNALAREVMALDPCVTQEFLKLYIAFKAETNFVDVITQSKGLRLVINMPFAELQDPRKICRDITKLGRWGNGDIDVLLSTMEDLPYMIGIIRQALDRQLGNGLDA
jgi:uncharacterized protein with ParB-like and HNH nuclease domain/predicted transport protein